MLIYILLFCIYVYYFFLKDKLIKLNIKVIISVCISILFVLVINIFVIVGKFLKLNIIGNLSVLVNLNVMFMCFS